MLDGTIIEKNCRTHPVGFLCAYTYLLVKPWHWSLDGQPASTYHCAAHSRQRFNQGAAVMAAVL